MADTLSDTDDDLERAIHLSLQNESGSVAKVPTVIDLVSDDDANVSERLSRPDCSLRASSDEHSTTGDPRRLCQPRENAEDVDAVKSSLLGLDRRQMEAERLERIRKRRVSLSPPPLQRKRQNLGNLETQSSNKIPSLKAQFIPPEEGNLSTTKLNIYPQPLSSHQQRELHKGIQYPRGVVKKTFADGHPRVDDVKIEEVLQKEDLDLAVLSAFQWDDTWILSKLDLRGQTKVVCVVQAESDEKKRLMVANAPSCIRFCFPSMEGQINCMHSKLMLLSHPTHLRVVVPSANLVPYDWGENGGVMENIVFMIDLPRLRPGYQDPKTSSPFKEELSFFLSAQGLNSKIIDSLSAFDFLNTSHLAFVHSVGGAHPESTWRRTGYCGLGAAARRLGLGIDKDNVDVDFASASIGSLNDDFILRMYMAARGDDGLQEYRWRTEQPKRSKVSSPTASCSEEALKMKSQAQAHFHIYFPTHETVAASKGGIGAGGTVCLLRPWFEGAKFPRALFRDYKSTRSGLLSHNKIMFVRLQRSAGVSQSEAANALAAWAYIGSANLSESAWGKLTRDRSTGQPKLNLRNWECGVIIPVRRTQLGDGAETECAGDEAARSMHVFAGTIPVPMEVPGEQYGDRAPWYFREN